MIHAISSSPIFELKQLRFYVFFLTFLLLTPNLIFAQSQKEPIRCSTDQWLEEQMKDPDFAAKFRETENHYTKRSGDRSPSCSNPLIIPIAIHWGGNVVDVPCLLDMVEDQIQVLNEDFGAYNEDISNYCDLAFECTDDYPFAAISGGTCIQFCLATQNHPSGSGLSDGDPAFTFGQYDFNNAGPWSGYLNIFVSDVPPPGYGSNLLGLAPLFGGANPDGNGVWVNANAFGGYEETCESGSVTINSYGNYDLGRTATHEVGHYYGLRHVFQGCGSGDLIDDTPAQSEPNYGVPTVDADCNSTAENTCGTQDFFFNYMDYTNDVAMYMFTSDQSDLMYEVANDGSYNSESTVCGTIPNSYAPTYPDGCYVCPDLSLDYTQNNVSCFDACDAAITIDDLIDGVAPFTYEWSTGDTGETINNLCPGDYFVTVTDNFGCNIIEVFTITEPNELFANASSTDENGNDFEDGTASADPTGGTQSYFYEWDNGETTQTIQNLVPGNYTVTVTDVNNCISSETVFIDEFICPDLSLQTFAFNTICFGECNGTIEVVDVANGVAPFVYIWSNGATTANNTDLCAGEYTVTVTDAVNCTVFSETYIVQEAVEMLGNISATDETAFDANDGTATVDPQGGTPPYAFEWSNGEQTQTITNLSPGIYSLTITDANECAIEEFAYIEAFFCPDFSFESSQADNYCFDDCSGMISIENLQNGTDPYFLDWSNGENGSTITDLCAGNYVVTISDLTGCEEIFTYEISQPEAMVTILDTYDESAFEANDGSAYANLSGGIEPYTYAWSNGETTEEITGLSPGDYSLTVSDGNGCVSTEEFSILAFDCPVLTIVSQQSELSCYEQCNGTLEITDVVNGTEPLSYAWSNGSNAAILTDLCAGNYTLTLTDAFNCAIISSFDIGQPTLLIANANAVGESAMGANDGSATADPSGGTAPYQFEWSNGATSQMIIDLVPGDYTLTVTDANGCSRIQTVTVEEYICQGIAIQSQIMDNPCYGDCLGSIEVTGVDNATEPFTYSWNNGATTNAVNGLCADEYSVTITDANNCTAQQTFQVNEPEEIILLTQEVTPVTTGKKGTISIETNGDYNYEWTGENGFKSTDKNLVDLDPGCYSLIISDPETNCTLDTIICVDDLTVSSDLWDSEILLYPNPVRDELTIDYSSIGSENVEITLYNLTGKSIACKKYEGKGQLMKMQTKALKSGVYMIRISWEGYQVFRKIVVLGI